MNKLYITLLILLSSCGIEKYDYITESVEITTDSLIQISKNNINKIISKTKHEHHFADSVATCLDSVKHELELKQSELQLAQLQRYREAVIITEVNAIEVEELKELKSVAIEYVVDTVFIHDTIYINSFVTVKEVIVELMTEKEKTKLKKTKKKEAKKKLNLNK